MYAVRPQPASQRHLWDGQCLVREFLPKGGSLPGLGRDRAVTDERVRERATMQKALVTILLAAVAGVPTYLLVWASPFGVSRGSPLGQLESMEAWLLDHGFAKKTLSAL